jgi:hypothetical protein
MDARVLVFAPAPLLTVTIDNRPTAGNCTSTPVGRASGRPA